MKKNLIIFIFIFSFFHDLNSSFIESLNKRFYSFNYGIEKILFYPANVVYLNSISSFFRNANSNFFKNAYDFQKTSNFFYKSVKLNNNLIFSRLSINTFFGIFGIFDLASFYKFNHEKFEYKNIIYNNDNGYYLFLPIFGPCTLRDLYYLLISQFFTPYFYFFDYLYLYYFFEIINIKYNLFIDIIFVEKNMINPYSFIKDAYYQNNSFSSDLDDFCYCDVLE